MNKKRFKQLIGLLTEQENSRDQQLGLSEPGYYWFFDAAGDHMDGQWQIVEYYGSGNFDHIASDEGSQLFSGSVEQYLALRPVQRANKILGKFVGPLSPPSK